MNILEKLIELAQRAELEIIKSIVKRNEQRFKFLSDKIVSIQEEYKSHTMEEVLEEFEVVIAIEDGGEEVIYRLYALSHLIENNNVRFDPEDSILSLL